MAVSRNVTIQARHGLHARPAMQLSALCQRHPGAVRIRKANAPAKSAADAKNILDIMILAAGKGEELFIEVDGVDAESCLDAICALLESEFDPQ